MRPSPLITRKGWSGDRRSFRGTFVLRLMPPEAAEAGKQRHSWITGGPAKPLAHNQTDAVDGLVRQGTAAADPLIDPTESISMSRPVSKPSLRELCGAIRHLDVPRARQLVVAFRRPVVHDGCGIGGGGDDQVVADAWGGVTLARATLHEDRSDVVGCVQTHLHLHKLLRLPLSVGRELAAHRGHLYLDSLTSITEAVADALACHEGGVLSLDGLQTISESAAASLGTHRGELSLNALTHLAAAAARGLARHAHELRLEGLESLEPTAAAALSCHRGNLYLNGISFLEDDVVRHLACHAGQLHLHGVAWLSDEAAVALGHRTGHLCLRGLARLSSRHAEVLANHRGELQIPSVPIDDAVADALGRHEGSLLIRVPCGVPLRRLEALVRHQGPLEISGLGTLDERRARVLAAQAGPRGLRGLSCLFIDGITRITPAVASILATHTGGGLALNDLTDLPEEVARELVKHPLLSLDRLERVSDGVAAVLATHAGATLSLRGLKEASPRAIAMLKATPSIELGRRHEPDEARSRSLDSAAAAEGHLQGQDLVRLIELIASQGEAALRNRFGASDGPA